MKFFTEVKPQHSANEINHADSIVTIGSCFADEIGNRLARDLFSVKVNPMGTLYNPMSIAMLLQRAIHFEPFDENDVFESNGQWHTLYCHSSMSRATAAATLDCINDSLKSLNDLLRTLHTIIITFGSARVFRHNATGMIVGNCHKLPANNFTQFDVSITEIIDTWRPILTELRCLNPQLNIIFTVSPIRHKAYGYHADRLSKATLLLAVDRLCSDCDCQYFPAYEIMQDELRDYRFYADDMIHPSNVACDHIYSRFADTYFSQATQEAAHRCASLSARLAHRFSNIDSDDRQKFIDGTMLEARKLVAQYPAIKKTLIAKMGSNPTFKNRIDNDTFA